uniref:Glutamyl aminopeptidase n=1 Tax=Steinernema glaseri TaxID=37863 RepID=A0A1I7YSS7_9BILA
MKWWSDLWLNEGFANYMEYLCADDLYPEWNVLNDFYVENFVQSMLLDGFASSHAVSNDVEDPAQIGSMFDVISYQKGASIIQMLRGLAGKDAFQIALQEYLKKYAYANAERIDLWNIIQKHVTLSNDISVADVAEAWTSQIGYPVIAVGLDRGSMVVRNQTRFLLLEEEREGDTSDTKWPIPIQYRSDLDDQVHMIWLKADQDNAVQRIGQNVKWVIANTGSLGYYRVLYDKDVYKQLIKQLSSDHEKLSAVDRATILNDAFFFAKSGHLGIDTALDLVQYVESKTEVERIPWVVIITHLKVIEQMISETPTVELFQKFEKWIFMRAYERLGWKRPEKHVDRMLQTEVLAMACRLQLSDCSRQAQNLFSKWLQDKNSVFVDIQPFVIEEGVRRGTTSDWERVYEEYLKTTNPSQKLLLLNALASTKNVKLIHRFMLMCLDPAIVRPNVLPRALGMLMQNKVASLYAWRFFRMNYDKFDKIIGGTTTMLGMMSKSIIENFNTEYDLQEVREFFKGKKMGASRARVDQAIESIVLNWDSKRRLNRK